MTWEMLLFRRKPRDKDDTTDASVDSAALPAAPGKALAPPPDRPASPAVLPPPTTPPPLPQPVPGAPAGSQLPGKFPQCFICGSTLEAEGCPQCKIAWVE